MDAPFMYWKNRPVKNGAVVTTLENVSAAWAMTDGESFKDRWPVNAAFRFDPEFKRDTLPVDSYHSIENMLVVSKRLKEFIETRSSAGLEYLPVTIYDHKGKPLAEPCFIVHPVDPVDCIDLAKSQVEWSISDPTCIDEVDHLEIDASKVPADRLLFRAKALKRSLIVRSSLAREIEQAGFTGAGSKRIA